MVRIHAPEPTPRSFMHRVFVYGTLQVDEILLAVLGRPFSYTAAVLHGYFRGMIDGHVYPGIAPQEGASVQGSLIERMTSSELTALDEYEGDLYERRQVQVVVNNQTIIAETYVVRPQHRDHLTLTPWDRSTFKRCHAKSFAATWA